MTFNDFLTQMAQKGVGIAAGARRAYVMMVSQGKHLLVNDEKGSRFVVYHDNQLIIVPCISGEFEKLSQEHQAQARRLWNTACHGDGFMYRNYIGNQVNLSGAICTREQLPALA